MAYILAMILCASSRLFFFIKNLGLSGNVNSMKETKNAGRPQTNVNILHELKRNGPSVMPISSLGIINHPSTGNERYLGQNPFNFLRVPEPIQSYVQRRHFQPSKKRPGNLTSSHVCRRVEVLRSMSRPQGWFRQLCNWKPKSTIIPGSWSFFKDVVYYSHPTPLRNLMIKKETFS